VRSPRRMEFRLHGVAVQWSYHPVWPRPEAGRAPALLFGSRAPAASCTSASDG
jgi:hypothetical protein